MSTLKKTVENILQLHITDWDDTWLAAEQQGKMTGSRTNKIILELCKAVETLQDEKK